MIALRLSILCMGAMSLLMLGGAVGFATEADWGNVALMVGLAAVAAGFTAAGTWALVRLRSAKPPTPEPYVERKRVGW